MLVIRTEQMVAISEAQWRDFVSLSMQHVQFRHPEVCAQLTGEQVRSRVQAGMERALSHGFTQSADLIRYLNLLFTVGADADGEPRFAQILAQSQYTPATRMDLVFRTLAEGEPAAEPEEAPPELPDATWPEPEPLPLPPAAVLLPPDESCMMRPPWEVSGGE